ncbi:MAG: response regulator transcription factor [Actinomycetia bacterium]|nr:response regulator transcription factor [Actinomycetes bacterium]MCP5033184.1 response regulator transcription factor [Actinomycetes bacterium]
MNRVLVVEDEPRIASFLVKGLQGHGYTTTLAEDGSTAIEKGLSGEFDLVILDLGLPDIDGLEVLHELKKWFPDQVVIVLTARDVVEDTVSALDAGAADYITKPFSFEELLARIRLRLRDGGEAVSTELLVGNTALDLRTRRLTVDGVSEELTAREYALAELFFRNPSHVLTRPQILSHVWGYDYEPDSNVVDVYVGYLRKKLGPARLKTIRGVGYRFEP